MCPAFPSSPAVSFVVPVYNKAPYLPKVLEGIRAQRGDFRRQYVFVDDGSTDGSAERLAALTRDWDNVVIERQANAGSAAATNKGIALASEPLIKFVDADDVLVPDATWLLLDALEKTGAILAWGGARDFIDPAALESPDAAPPLAPDSAPCILAEPLKPALQNSLFNPSQFLARTEAVRESGGCDERVVFSQEYGLTLRLARLGSFAAIDRPVVWRAQAEQGRLSNNRGRQLQRVSLACAWFLRDYPDTPRALQHFAFRRAAGRAWKYARRFGKAGWGSPYFRLNLRSYLPLPGADYPGLIERTACAFDIAAPVQRGDDIG